MDQKASRGDTADTARRPLSRGGRNPRIGFALASALLIALTASCAGRAGEPWSVLLITIDTLRADRLGCYGGDSALTPNIDRLASEGTQFGNAFAAMPITLPSHTSIMTGLYPRHHGVLSHAYTLPQKFRTAAELFRDEGYHTAAFVSSHVLDRKYGVDQGFDTYWQRYDYGPKKANRILHESGYDISTEAVTLWGKRAATEPYFAWVHWFHPHKPYEPPPPFDKVYDRRPDRDVEGDVQTLEKAWKGEIDLNPEEVGELRSLYEGEVAYTDRQVGLVLQSLREQGLLDHTIVVLTADHGEMLYEHDRYFGHDIMLYDPSIHVPLIVWAPGLVPAGEVLDTVVRSVDLLPTLAALAGCDPPAGTLDGRSFVPAFRGESLPDVPVLVELFPPKDNWKSPPRHSVRYEDWKLIRTDGRDDPQLFHLDDDPGENRDLATADGEQLRSMDSLLAGLTSVEVKERRGRLTPEEERNLRALGYLGGSK